MTDDELRDRLASEFEEAAEPTGHICHDMYSFKAGWDAARANVPALKTGVDANSLLAERDCLMKERDSLKDQLQWSLKNEEQYKQAFAEQCERANQLHAEVERLKEELVAYQIGSSIEAKAGDEARVERDRLKRQVEVMREALLWMDDAVAAHAMRSKANEALAEVEKIERGES